MSQHDMDLANAAGASFRADLNLALAALVGKAQTAQGCYQRALRTTDVSGSMTVSVQVSSTGSVCNVSIANDTLHSPEVSSCVLGRFRGQSLPPPNGGCITANIPISFKSKQ